MEKKVEEIVNSTKNETVNDLLTLFNSKIGEPRTVQPYEWKYKLEIIDLKQPDTVCGVAHPRVVVDKDLLLFSFNGKSIFYDKNFTKFYISVPSNTKDMAIFRTEAKEYLITLDQSNKLFQCEIKENIIQQDKVLISRNVVRLVKHNEVVYFISFKKDLYNINALHVDDSVLRPKIIISQMQVKYFLDIFPTKFGIFINKDGKLGHEDGRKLSIKGDGVVDIDNYIIVYKKEGEEMRLSLLNEEMVIKNEITVFNNSNNLYVKSLGPLVGIRAGLNSYFIEVFNNKMVVGHEITYEKYPASVSYALDGDKLKVYNLCANELKPPPREKFEFSGASMEGDLPAPSENSRIYDPILTNMKGGLEIDAIVERLFKRFENKIEERELNEKKRQNELLDKISDHLNLSLVKVVQKVIKTEMESVQKKLSVTIDNRFLENENNRTVDEARVLQFTKDIICDTLLPIVEASMDEMRIQVLNEVKQMNNIEHLQDIRKHLSNLSLSNASMSEISSLLLRNRVEDCLIKVIEGGDVEVEEFLRVCDVNCLVDVNSGMLLGLLEKLILYSSQEMSFKRDEVVRAILSDIEPSSLSDEELSSFQIVLSQLKDSDLIERPENDSILFLCSYFTKQIKKMLSKRKGNRK